MAQCIKLLSKDLGFDCDDKVKGVEKRLLLINRQDIDFAGTQIENNKITSLILKNEKKAYSIDYLNDTHVSVSTKPEFSDEDFNGHKHSIGIKIYGKTPEDYEQIDALVDGAELVAVVENKGANDNAFEVYGFYMGLVATEGEGRTNGGVYSLTIATPSNYKEPKSVLKWLETDFATTKARFDKKLANE